MTPYDDTKVEIADAEEAEQAELQQPGSEPTRSKGHEYYDMKNAMRRTFQRRLRTRRIASFKR